VAGAHQPAAKPAYPLTAFIPGGLLRSYWAVTLRERECNERHAARARINTGVFVFTRVNIYGISS